MASGLSEVDLRRAQRTLRLRFVGASAAATLVILVVAILGAGLGGGVTLLAVALPWPLLLLVISRQAPEDARGVTLLVAGAALAPIFLSLFVVGLLATTVEVGGADSLEFVPTLAVAAIGTLPATSLLAWLAATQLHDHQVATRLAELEASHLLADATPQAREGTAAADLAAEAARQGVDVLDVAMTTSDDEDELAKEWVDGKVVYRTRGKDGKGPAEGLKGVEALDPEAERVDALVARPEFEGLEGPVSEAETFAVEMDQAGAKVALERWKETEAADPDLIAAGVATLGELVGTGHFATLPADDGAMARLQGEVSHALQEAERQRAEADALRAEVERLRAEASGGATPSTASTSASDEDPADEANDTADVPSEPSEPSGSSEPSVPSEPSDPSEPSGSSDVSDPAA